MKKTIGGLLTALLLLALLTPAFAQAAAADRTTHYRVYQNANLLMEFAAKDEAIAYAKRYAYSYVEEIGTRKLLWHNFPRYYVYQFHKVIPQGEFASLDEAVAKGKRYLFASVRDTASGGWVWHSYPRYVVYQGTETKNEWRFTTYDAAVKAAGKQSDAHIIDLETNRWVWDNLSPEKKQALREGSPVYRVYQHEYSAEDWQFAYLEDAIREALKWANSRIVDLTDGRVVFSNEKKYEVYQDDRFVSAHVGLNAAIAAADGMERASVRLNGQTIWTNAPFYEVRQGGKRIGGFPSFEAAVDYAVRYADSEIVTQPGRKIWSNERKLLFWGWNGMSADQVIKAHVEPTFGLDVDSPTWFQLEDALGTLKDTSSAETVRWLKARGIQVHPLVHNQFDREMTSAFLADAEARQRFIFALVERSAELGVDGINLDFESVAGSDRDAFTRFVAELSAAAKSKGLKLSIDLPRGDVAWNHLTAFDHKALAPLVDYVVTMTYDQHYSGSPTAGSVSGLAWAEEGVRQFLAYGIPREKLLLGIPLYMREWTIAPDGTLLGNRPLLMKDVPALMEREQTVSIWDDRYGQYRIEYAADGNNRVFWLEDERTIKARLDIAKRYDLAGIAFWRLGYEPDHLWKSLLPQK